ncbi:putative membrane protein, TIGR04086 family [Schinkia azotoformans MEV2011]|uniref:Putative membrane protein, TIGR04086 family n=1 Tax=Schinkia azotoformans MEV2011 TaxID=1348973 RepID=A0A072P1P1_SCHAZ|nr:TIGR04086 family membrane protein [Schinkia azotoformans]KEF39410.1 putative membrane protein, TIGR04086 family [Schinkia azotoformans MEV2011]MEC1696794.1 TIGR04086 family membrane protein [Schinkia azotoformans]MEC1720304.1 TIGR04086 family membrane protein [Schinkia azotoformans]MEC1726673.1 TIGR04086 family membrane protein [Schinkia azotoformans]MEC1772407.1 TIGR04086 family membrane protein [Schinkia azotoformans]
MAKNSFAAILYGVITTFVIVLTSSIVLSLLLRFTKIQESSLTWVILTLSFLALFIGGFVSGGKGKQKGWFVGGGTGVLFTLLIFLVQFLGYQTSFSIEQMSYHIGYIIIAVLGGVIGVNMTGKRA